MKKSFCCYCKKKVSSRLICKDCFFIKPKVRKYCNSCGKDLDRKGLMCKYCYLSKYYEPKGIRRILKTEAKNPCCVFVNRYNMCKNRVFCFQGITSKCDYSPRTECKFFRARNPDVLEFLAKKKKATEGSKNAK